VLGLERAFHIDLADLDRHWRARSRQVHPDRFARKSAVLRRMSLQWTALVNDARRVLRDPVSRAWYLATGRPRPPARGSAASDSDFLERVFEWRMALAEGDATVRVEVEAAREALMGELGGLFSVWEHQGGDLDAVPAHLQRLTYLDNLLRHDA